MDSDTEIVSWSVELREKEVVAGACVVGAGEQNLKRVELLAIGHPALVAAEAAQFGGQFRAVELRSALGEDIDNGEEGIGAIQGGTGTAYDLNTINKVHIQQELGADVR